MNKKTETDHSTINRFIKGGNIMMKMLQVPVTLLLIFSLMGCGMTKTDNEKNNATNNATNTGTETKVGTETTNDHVNENVNNNISDGVDTNTTHGHKVEVADKVADDVAAMKEVESANVLVTDANAYVAVELKEGNKGDEHMENKIAEHVRKGNENFKNVYVSMNPDFVKQMHDYGTKIREGEPVEGFFEEFSDTVRRVFPDAH